MMDVATRAKLKTSIALKMARSNLLASSFALVLATAAFMSYDFLSFRRIMVDTLSGYADMIGINSASALIFDDKNAAKEILSSLRVRPDILVAAIYNAKGEKFVHYRRTADVPAPATVLIRNVAMQQGWMDNTRMVVTHDINFRGQFLGVVYLEASLSELRDRAIQYIGIGLAVFLASMLLSWLVSRQLQRKITGPIFGLTRVAENVSRQGDYSVRADKQSEDEVGTLADAFNDMLGRIQQQNDALNRARDELEQRVAERTHELAEEIEVRRRTEEILRENEERFRTLVELAPDAVLNVDSGGLINLVNSRTEALFGYPRHELLGKSVEMLVPSEYRLNSEAGDWLHSVVDSGTMLEAGRELEGLRKDGRRVPIEVRLSPIHTRDEGVILAIIRNISARKESERAIKALNNQLAEKVTELTSVNMELEAFSYSVSHDLRAPLRAIDGFSNSLLEDCAGQLDTGARNYLNRICAAAQRMGMLIDDLLNLSRITRTVLTRETVDLSAMVTGILDQLSVTLPDRKVRLKIAAGVMVYADARLVRVALENLLGNAWKFTRHAADAEIEFGAREEDGVTVYFLLDNGAGFNMTYVNKLFEPFQRLHTDREYEGTGIGLAIVKRVIQRHGGRIWAEGAPGEGARFYFTFG